MKWFERSLRQTFRIRYLLVKVEYVDYATYLFEEIQCSSGLVGTLYELRVLILGTFNGRLYKYKFSNLSPIIAYLRARML